MKLSVLLSTLIISSLVESIPVPPTVGPSSGDSHRQGTSLEGSWSIDKIKNESEEYYTGWEKKGVDSIEQQATQDEHEAIRSLGSGDKANAAHLMTRSITLRFLRSKKLFEDSVSKAELEHLKHPMSPNWDYLGQVRVNFIGLYLSQIDRHAAYTNLLQDGLLPPYNNVKVVPENFYSEWAETVYTGTQADNEHYEANIMPQRNWQPVIHSCYSRWEKLSKAELQGRVNVLIHRANELHGVANASSDMHMLVVLLMRLIVFRKFHGEKNLEVRCVQSARRVWPSITKIANSLDTLYGGYTLENQGGGTAVVNSNTLVELCGYRL